MAEIRKTYKFRLYPNLQAERELTETLDTCRWLYNSALEERKLAYENWKEHGQYKGEPKPKPNVSQYSQSRQVTELKEDPKYPLLQKVKRAVLTEVLIKLDKAFTAFFSRVKQGQTPGYPRFKSKTRYDSFTYPDTGWSLHNNKLTLQHSKGYGRLVHCTRWLRLDHWLQWWLGLEWLVHSLAPER